MNLADMKLLQKESYCYFLIWGPGMPYKDEIFRTIREKPFIEILTVMHYEPKSLDDLIRGVYSYEYLQFEHHKAKLEYLSKTDQEVIIIFAINKDRQERYWGDHTRQFIHSESLKQIKEEIRTRFDPRTDGKRTHEHVIHSSDNEGQVHRVLKYLGIKQGLKFFQNVPNPILSTSWFLPNFDEFVIRNSYVTHLYGNIFQGTKESYWKENILIEDTPHFAYLCGDTKPYEAYLANFSDGPLLGGPLYWQYCLDKFTKLAKNFAYLQDPYETSYILVREFQPNQYVVVDGIHRASILRFKKVDQCAVAVIK